MSLAWGLCRLLLYLLLMVSENKTVKTEQKVEREEGKQNRGQVKSLGVIIHTAMVGRPKDEEIEIYY